MKPKKEKVSSIDKALDILLAFTPQGREMGTVDLSKLLNIHPATVNRILQNLASKGFLKQNTRSRKFRLGRSVFRLGRTVFQNLSGNLLNIAVPYLEELCEEVGETVVLEIMSGNRSIVSYVEQGSQGISIAPRVGDFAPLHVGAGAKAMLAHMDPKRVERLLGTELKAYASKTLTDKAKVLRQIDKAKRDNVAFCKEEWVDGFNAIGSPIFDHRKKPVAAVIVTGLASRLECNIHSTVVNVVKNTASNISKELFYEDEYPI